MFARYVYPSLADSLHLLSALWERGGSPYIFLFCQEIPRISCYGLNMQSSRLNTYSKAGGAVWMVVESLGDGTLKEQVGHLG